VTVHINIKNATITIYDSLVAQLAKVQSFSALQGNCPVGGQSLNVTPGGGTALGTICAAATYGPCIQTGNPPQIVYAMVYPYNLLPGGPTTNPVPFPGTGQAVPSARQTPMGSNMLYYWPALGGADPGNTAAGGQNWFVLWSAVTSNITPTSSDKLVQFTGVATGGTSCCSGSASGGGMATATNRELAGVAHLSVVVPDGTNNGTYRATAVGPLKWHVTIGGIPYVVSVDSGTVTLASALGSATATSVMASPFYATFPGAILGSDADIVITRP
jgi:hypothetical protein